MLFSLDISTLPRVKKSYCVTRNTVWQIRDEDHILIFILAGACSISSGGETFLLEEGDVFFLPANQAYIRKPVGDTLCTMLYIHFSASGEVQAEEHAKAVQRLVDEKEQLDMVLLSGVSNVCFSNQIYLQYKNRFSDRALLEPFLKNRIQEKQKPLMTYNMWMSVKLCDVLCALTEDTLKSVLTAPERQGIRSIPQKLQKATEYVAMHYTEPITLSDIARHLNLSKQQLTRYFKAGLSTTPMKYVTEFKLIRAKELLFNQPELMVKEISDRLGFDNQNYFSKAFARTFGESPTHYRYRTTHYEKNKKEY